MGLLRRNEIQFAKKWQLLRPKSSSFSPRERCAVAACDELHVILIGGEDENGAVSDAVTKINVKTGEATEMPRLNRAKRSCSAILLGRKLYVFGGWVGVCLADVEVLDLDNIAPDGRFLLLGDFQMPEALHSASLLSYGGAIYVIGGYNDQYLRSVYRFQVGAKYEWSVLPSLNVARLGPMSVVRNGQLLVFGGYNYDDKNLCSVEALPLNDDDIDGELQQNSPLWTLFTDKETNLPEGRAFGVACMVGDQDILVVGGQGNCGKWLKTCSYFRNRRTSSRSILTPSEQRFYPQPCPPFPGPVGWLMSVASLPKFFVFVSKERNIYTLPVDSADSILAHGFGMGTAIQTQVSNATEVSPAGVAHKPPPQEQARVPPTKQEQIVEPAPSPVQKRKIMKQKKRAQEDRKKAFREQLTEIQNLEKVRREKQKTTRSNLVAQTRRLEEAAASIGSKEAVQRTQSALNELRNALSSNGGLYPSIQTLRKEAETIGLAMKEIKALELNDDKALMKGFLKALEAIEERIKKEQGGASMEDSETVQRADKQPVGVSPNRTPDPGRTHPPAVALANNGTSEIRTGKVKAGNAVESNTGGITKKEFDDLVALMKARQIPPSSVLLDAFANVDAYELKPSLKLISKFSEDVSMMIEDSLRGQTDDAEIASILATPRLRDFYLAMLQHLKSSFKAIESLSSGLVGENMGMKITLLKMFQTSQKRGDLTAKTKQMRLGKLTAHAIDKAIKQFGFLPGSDLLGSVVGLLLGMKDGRQGAMAAVNVSLFGVLCESMHNKSSYGGAEGALERITRVTVRCYHDRGLIPGPDQKFKWRKQQVLRIAGASNCNTPIKEAGAIAAQQVVEHISNPPTDNESCLLNRLYEGDKSVICPSSDDSLTIPDIVVAEVFELGVEEVGQLPRIQDSATKRRLEESRLKSPPLQDGTLEECVRVRRRVADDSAGASRPEQRRSSVDSDAAKNVMMEDGEAQWSSSSSCSSSSTGSWTAPITADEVAERKASASRLEMDQIAILARIRGLEQQLEQANVAKIQAQDANDRAAAAERRANEMEERHRDQLEKLRHKARHLERELKRVNSNIRKVMKKSDSTEEGVGLAQAYIDPGRAIGDLTQRMDNVEQGQVVLEQRIASTESATVTLAEDVSSLNRMQGGLVESEPLDRSRPAKEDDEDLDAKKKELFRGRSG